MADDTTIDPAIAEAMGFSTFGGQPSSKRRKFDRDDAVTWTTPSNKSQNGPRDSLERNQPSTVASTSKKQKGKQKQSNPVGLAGFLAHGQSLKPPGGTQPDTAILNDNVSHPESVLNLENGPTPENRPDIQTVSNLASHSSLPARPSNPVGSNAALVSVGSGETKLTREELSALRRGVKDARGDIAYFLPSFVEDPWKEL